MQERNETRVRKKICGKKILKGREEKTDLRVIWVERKRPT